MGLSNAEVYFTAIIIAKVSGCLSMIGSFLIIIDVILRWRRQKEQQYLPIKQRIILSMSIADLISSFTVHLLGTWMVPKGDVFIFGETLPTPLATGNETTCNIQAFIWDLCILAGCGSNATLGLTYWLMVCKDKKDDELKKWKWQFPLVWLPWLFALADSLIFVVGLGFYAVNQSWFCGSFVLVNSSNAWRNLMLVVVAGLINIVIISTMVALVKFVYTLEKELDAYQRNGETLQKTIRVAKQGICFIMAYMAALVPALISIIFNNLPRYFALYTCCMFPLQGLFNTLVYFRPKYLARDRE